MVVTYLKQLLLNFDLYLWNKPESVKISFKVCNLSEDETMVRKSLKKKSKHFKLKQNKSKNSQKLKTTWIKAET